MKLYIDQRSPMSKKAILANALFGMNLEEIVVDVMAGGTRTPDFLTINPNGKVPVLEFEDGSRIWESNAVINRMAAESGSDMWPKSNDRYDIMRWQFWEAAHFTPLCSPFIFKKILNDETVNVEEATKKLDPFASVLNDTLSSNEWVAGNQMTTADISLSGILAYRKVCEYPLEKYTHLVRWIEQIESLPAWQKVKPE